MNPQEHSGPLCIPSSSRTSATLTWTPGRNHSGSTITPPGRTWSNQYGETSHTPTVATIRSKTSPPGAPTHPSPVTTRTFVTPATRRCSCASATVAASRSMLVTAPAPPTSRPSSAAL